LKRTSFKVLQATDNLKAVMSDKPGGPASDRNWSNPASMQVVPTRFLWLAGLVSTIYLVVGAAMLGIYATVTLFEPQEGPSWWNLGVVAVCALPACFFAAIGLVGLTSGSGARRQRWRKTALVLQIVMALATFANPISFILMLADWVTRSA
jgi:hypothetical protein